MINEQDDYLNGENSSFGTGHHTLITAKQRIAELAVKLEIAKQLLKEAVESYNFLMFEASWTRLEKVINKIDEFLKEE